MPIIILLMSLKKKINNLIKKSGWYNRLFLGCDKFWTLNDFGLEVVNLGSTASYYAFDYSGIKLKSANFALTSQYLLADYEILRNYSSYIKKGATIILGTCLFSLDGYDVTYFDDRYYTILSPSSIWHFSSKRLKDVVDLKDNPIKYYPLMALYKEIKSRFFRKNTKSLTNMEMQQNAHHWMECWAKEFSIENFDEPLSIRNRDLVEQALDILSKIRAFCDEKGFRLVMVQAPVSPSMHVFLTPEMRQNYVYVFHNSEKLEGIEYYDYLDDPDFEDETLFRNAYVMNGSGAVKFTNKVLSDLKLL